MSGIYERYAFDSHFTVDMNDLDVAEVTSEAVLVAEESYNYLEEILGNLDFTSLDKFLNQHMRVEMNFGELVSQIAVHGLDALNKENLTMLVFDALFYELSIAKPIFVKMLEKIEQINGKER